MAEWNPSTPYGPGATVTYQGLPYARSQYPPTATSGTNPKQEMSVDSKNDPIRTCILTLPSPGVSTYPFHIGYFSLKAADIADGLYYSFPETDPPPTYPGKFLPENPYAGGSENFINAYGPIYEGGNGLSILGETIEVDQARGATVSPPLPSAPVMPANKCGVAMQQIQEIPLPDPLPSYPTVSAQSAHALTFIVTALNPVYDPVLKSWVSDAGARPRVYYFYAQYNHPLYFRRQHTIRIRITTENYDSGYTIPDTDPPVVVEATGQGIVSSNFKTFKGTDKNYATYFYGGFGGDFFNPANAVAEYTLPDDVVTEGPYDSVQTTTYTFIEAGIYDVEAND